MTYSCRLCTTEIDNFYEAYITRCGHVYHKTCLGYWYRDFRTGCAVCHGAFEEQRSPSLSSGYSSRSSSVAEQTTPKRKPKQVFKVQNPAVFHQVPLTPVQLWNDAVSLLFANPKTYKEYGLE